MKINSFSYTNFNDNAAVTGGLEIHNSQIKMSDIDQTPLIPDGNVWVSTDWIWNNDYVIPGKGSTYGFSVPIKIQASGFLWVPNAIVQYQSFGFTDSVN